MTNRTEVFKSEARWSRTAIVWFEDNKVVFDCSDEEYGPIEFNIDLLVKAYHKHYDIDSDFWDVTLNDGLENEPPFISDDFQIGPDGAYEHTEEIETINLQKQLLELYENQIMDLTMMSKIELGNDVIAEIKRLKDLLNENK